MNIKKCTNVSGRALHLCKKAHCGKLAYALQGDWYTQLPPSHLTSSWSLQAGNSLHSQLLRLRCICSDNDDFAARAKEMKAFFQARGYPKALLNGDLYKISTVSRNEALAHSPTRSLLPSLTHSLAPSLTRSLTHSLTHSLRYCVTATPLLQSSRNKSDLPVLYTWCRVHCSIHQRLLA